VQLLTVNSETLSLRGIVTVSGLYAEFSV